MLGNATKGWVLDMVGDQAEYEQRLKAVETKANKNTEDIASNKEDIETNAANIETNTEAISTINSDLSDIQSSNDWDSITKNKLISLDYSPESSKNGAGLTAVTNDDGSVTINGTATANAGLYFVGDNNPNYFSDKIGKTYIISGCPSGGSSTTYGLLVASADWQTSFMDTGQGYSFTVTDNTKYVVISIKSGTVCDNLTFYPMLREAGTDSTYVPYVNVNKGLQNHITTISSKLSALNFSKYECAQMETVIGAGESYHDYTYSFTKSYTETPNVLLNGLTDTSYSQNVAIPIIKNISTTSVTFRVWRLNYSEKTSGTAPEVRITVIGK